MKPGKPAQARLNLEVLQTKQEKSSSPSGTSKNVCICGGFGMTIEQRVAVVPGSLKAYIKIILKIEYYSLIAGLGKTVIGG